MKLDKREIDERCSDMFKLTLCRRYYEERHKWPPLTFSGEESASQEKLHGTWDETPRDPLRSRDFKGARFEFTMHVDSSHLLCNRSIIPTRDHRVYGYDNQAHHTLYGQFMKRPAFAS